MAGSLLKTWDPAALITTWRGILIGGYAEDSQVKIARDEASFTLKVGTTGEVVRSRNRRRSGYVEFHLMQTSASNDLLSAAMIEDENFGTGTGALLIRDVLGTTIVNGDQCFLEKPADSEFAKEAGERVWKVIVPDMAMFVGGAFPNP